MMGFFEILSGLFGLVYTTAWSVSFYPQPLLNYRRKSTTGSTIDFPLINTLGTSIADKFCLSALNTDILLGFAAYLVSNAAFYYSPLIRAQYAARYKGLTPTVQGNDVAFAAHGLLLCIVTTSQYLYPRAWGITSNLGSRPSRFILGIFFGCVVGVVTVLFIVLNSPERDSTQKAVSSWVWLDAIYAISYVKLVVTLIKYTPQVIANYRNRSTRGWSILQILLDFGGGILSIAQQSVDSYLQGDWSGITGNPVKFALGNVSMIYDLVFMTQHYVLYRGADRKAGEEEDSFLGVADEERRID
jgi:cystinosin